MRGNLGGNRLRLTKAQREEILQTYLNKPEAGTLLAMSLGLSAAYAYRLANERGLLPITRWNAERFPNRDVPMLRQDPGGDPSP